MKHSRLSRIATLSLTIAAVAAPTAMAREDILPPDATAAGSVTASQQPRAKQDLVSPDARDAARTSSLAGTADTVDRRTPDARDAAEGRGTFSAPEVTVVKVAQPAPASSGLDWGDAGIGAGAVVGLMLIALGSVLAIVHRRQAAQQRPQGTATIA
jgi:hypothetical protein